MELEGTLFWIAFSLFVLTALFLTSVARHRGFFHLPQVLFGQTTLSFPYVVCAFGIYLSVILLVKKLISNRAAADLSLFYNDWIFLAYMTFIFIALMVYVFWACPRSIREVIFNGKSPKVQLRSLGLGALTWCLAYPWVYSVNLLTDKIGRFIWQDTTQEQSAIRYLKSTFGHPLAYALTVFVIIVFVPIIEELLFRGFLQSWLRRYLKRGGGLVVTALLFTLAHYSPEQGGANFAILCSLFILSLFLGFLYEREQTLLAPIGLHATFNATTILMMAW